MQALQRKQFFGVDPKLRLRQGFKTNIDKRRALKHRFLDYQELAKLAFGYKIEYKKTGVKQQGWDRYLEIFGFYQHE